MAQAKATSTEIPIEELSRPICSGNALRSVGTTVLHPVLSVKTHVPADFTGGIVQLVSGLKGQVLGFEANPDASGRDKAAVQK